MFCRKCGSQIPDDSGAPTGAQMTQTGGMVEDQGNVGWTILGFFIPIVGLILFLVWKDSKPVSAKQAGKGALISVIIEVVLYILIFALVLGGIIVLPTLQ